MGDFHRPKGLPAGAHVVCNVYRCDGCVSDGVDTIWEDRWDSACDDECPACGHDVTPSDSEDDPDCDCDACVEARAAEAPTATEALIAAARALLAAYGGDTPDWLRSEAAALEAAIETAATETYFERRS